MNTANVENVFLNGGKLSCLDGWRAVAILNVIFSHSVTSHGFPELLRIPFKYCSSGSLGVRFFFVLSGFLITLLILREYEKTDDFRIGGFWLRRILRILPVYYCHLFLLFVVQNLTDFSMTESLWVRTLTFTSNYGEGQWLPGHLWSLCVEEQFYLVWPLVLLLFYRRQHLLFALAAAILILSPISRTVGYLYPEEILLNKFSLTSNMDSLAWGCITAFACVFRYDFVFQSCSKLWPLIIAFAMIAIPHLLSLNFLLGVFTVPLGPSCQSLGFAFLMIASILYRHHWATAWLRVSAVETIGVLSYSWYIWQQIFCSSPETFGATDVWFLQFPYWILVSFVVACISYRFVELPFLRLKNRIATTKKS